MSFNSNPNLKIVGFFGQSGSGKTTTIRNVPRKVDDFMVLQNVGIIRYLFRKNSNTYLNPLQIVKDNLSTVLGMTDAEKRNAKIKEIYDKYIRSQMQLLNDWSTEILNASREDYSSPSILLVDRSPVDFYAITVCGMRYLTRMFESDISQMHEHLITLNKKIAVDNTNSFLNAIFVIKPWKMNDINNLKDGVRDHYLTDDYTGDNWYSVYNEMNFSDDILTFTIESDITNLQERANLVGKKLIEVK